MSCEGCHTTRKAIEQSVQSALKQAKDWAIAHKENAVVYVDEQGEARFMGWVAARELNINPVGIVSWLVPNK